MSTTYKALTIVGIPAKDAVSVQIITTNQTKYNQDTGKPYLMPTVKYKLRIGNVELESVQSLQDLSSKSCEYSDDEDSSENTLLYDRGLDLLDNGYIPDESYEFSELAKRVNEDIYIGRRLDLEKGMDVEIVRETFDAVKKALLELGVEASPKLYSILYCGY